MNPTERDGMTGERAGQTGELAGCRMMSLVPSPIYTIFEGTSEIQRLVIARTLSGMPIR
ncbi:hypothetical protein [Streptomyces sp. NPDC057579]|uniref:hypothetical protein n=1 Tax=Streptomyces sp. NPDC057579 TaxID=3346172 RepID=UPI0036B3BC66